MPTGTQNVLEPRKSPVQARSAASVDAILEATIQVLLQIGKERLTTTRVAQRAGVSVGTLYQYFPNKSALLQATLRRHFEGVAAAVERVCQEQRGQPLQEQGAALAEAFLRAKMRDGKESVALYAVSSDVDGVEVAQEMARRTHRMICEMLLSAREPAQDAALVATVLQGVLSGISRQLLESESLEERFEPLQRELVGVVTAYLAAATCTPHTS